MENSLKFTFETVGSYEHSYNSGKLFWESFNIVRFVVKNRFGGTTDFPVKSREEALKLAVTLPTQGCEIVNMYECEHCEEDKTELYSY